MSNKQAEINKIDRILNEIEKDNRNKWIETLSTFLLSAATILSAWCVFQSSQWNGEQYFRIEDENVADRNRLQKEIASRQRLAADAQLFLQYATAKLNNSDDLADFLGDRFPAHLKKAAIAWWALEPMHNSNAPVSPMHMKEYVLPEQADIEKFSEQAKEFKREANKCDQNSDNYMLLSLVLSMVLFFSGLVGVMDLKTNKLILIGFASSIFLVALFFVIRFPMMF